MNGVFRTWIRSSEKYRYVSLWEFIANGKKKLQWGARLPNGYGGCSAYCDSEYDAALFVDKKLISIGRQPINILIKK